MLGYLVTCKKEECFGCGACYQICPRNAISMKSDEEGFRYPVIDEALCIHCDKCRNICPVNSTSDKNKEEQLAWGGYHKTSSIREQSTSGGAFTAIAEVWIKDGAVVFGAEMITPTRIVHTLISDINESGRLRKSKYLQSDTGTTYKQVKQLLREHRKVLYSGTPCQIAGLRSYLGSDFQSPNLLTVEVVCEGVPSPIFTEKYILSLEKKYKKKVVCIDWRDKNKSKWDFEFTRVTFEDSKEYKLSRWFNPFWSIWLKHLMSRPSCYICPFTTKERVADITIADLWGVHLYCPELYGNNGGSSLVVCNTQRGKDTWGLASVSMFGHTLDLDEAIKYQSPMRKCIDNNPDREEFIKDLKELDYNTLCKKWATKPTLRLLFQKYVYGNRQKVALWKLKKLLTQGGDKK